MQYSFCMFSFLCFEIYKGANFSQNIRIVKITVVLQFSCLCVLKLTFFGPIDCTVVDVGILDIGVSSMFAIAYNS